MLEAYSATSLRAAIVDPSIVIHIHEVQDGINGYVRMKSKALCPILDVEAPELETLYVQPAVHGQGVGRRLLAIAASGCERSNELRLWLTLNPNNTQAIAFYRHCGLDKLGEVEVPVGEQNILNEVWVMRAT